MRVSAAAFAAQTMPAPLWLLPPYLPREGVVFLYGKKGVGKSPLTWSLAQAVSTGEPWLGHPIHHAGQVLYIEVDSPPSVVHERARRVLTSSLVELYFPPDPLLCGPAGYSTLSRETADLKPVLVIFNTLRKIHGWDDKQSDTPHRVYRLMRLLWPSACLLFVHHEKKDPTDPDRIVAEGEEYSGSLAWHNDAQVCLRLHIPPGHPLKEGQRLQLSNTGNQVTAKADPLRLILDADGATITREFGTGPRGPFKIKHLASQNSE